MAIDLRNDEFNDGKLSDFWDFPWGIPTGVFFEEKDGFAQWECRTDCEKAWLVQDLQLVGDFDIWSRLILPTAAEVSPVDASVGIWWQFGNGLNWLDFNLSYTKSTDTDFETGQVITPRQFVLFITGWNDVAGTEVDRVGAYLGQDNNAAYIRLRFKAGVATWFYCIDRPCVEGDWVEMLAEFETTLELDGFNYFGVAAFGNTGNDTDKIFKMDFVRPWISSDLQQQYRADLDDVFYNLAEFAEEIIYTSRGGSPQTIRAVILDQDSSLSEGFVLGDSLQIRVRCCDVWIPGRDTLLLYGEQWFVIRNIGGGLSIGEWELEISRSEKRSL